MADRRRNVSIIIEARNNASKALREIGLSLGEVAAAAGAITAAAGYMGFALTKVTQAAARQENADVRLAIALASIGENTAQARDSLSQFATSLENSTGVGDEAIQELMATLVQLGRVSLAQLPRVTRDTLDLAAVTGQDLASAAELMARAAQGSTETLRRYGIVLDDSIPKSQRFAALLETIEKDFGGTAQEAAGTFSAALKKIDNDWDNLLQALGEAVIENKAVRDALEAASTLLQEATGFVKTHHQAFDALITLWVKGAIAVTRLTVQFVAWESELISANIRAAEFLTTMSSIVLALGAMAAKKLGFDPDLLANAAAGAAKLVPQLEKARTAVLAIGDAGTAALKDLDDLLAGLKGHTVNAAAGIKNFGTAGAGAGDQMKELNDILKDLGIDTLQTLKAKTEEVWRAVDLLLKAQAESADPAQFDPLVESVIAFAESLKTIPEDLSNTIVQARHVRDLMHEIEDAAAEAATQGLMQMGDAAVDAAFGAKRSWSDTIKSILAGIAKAILQALILKAIEFGFGGGGGTAAGAGINIGGGTVALQQGGEIRGGIPGLDSVRALLMPGEIVLPASRRQDFDAMTDFARSAITKGEGGAAGASEGIHLHLSVAVIDRRRLVADLIDGLNEAVERRGYRLLASEVLP